MKKEKKPQKPEELYCRKCQKFFDAESAPRATVHMAKAFMCPLCKGPIFSTKEIKASKNKHKVQNSTPGWVWLFIILCLSIPIITLGGAIPGAIGGGGVSLCLLLARNSSYSSFVRSISCLIVAISCWGIFLFLFGTDYLERVFQFILKLIEY